MKTSGRFLILLTGLWTLLAASAHACETQTKEAHIGRGTMPYLMATTNATGTPILLVHGLFAQKEQWLDLLCRLADAGYRPIAPDLPGYGQSQGYDLTVYPLEAQASLLAEFSQAIGLEHQHIAGNSMGGAIAALYAQAHPDRIRSLAFIGGPLGIGAWGRTVQQHILAGDNPFIPLSPTALDAELAMLLERPPVLTPETQAAMLAPYQQHTMHYIQVWNIVNLYDRILADRPVNRLPTLILWGEQDQVFNIAASKALARQYPRHRQKTLPATGHLPMIDSPALVSEAYIAFLKHPSH